MPLNCFRVLPNWTDMLFAISDRSPNLQYTRKKAFGK